MDTADLDTRIADACGVLNVAHATVVALIAEAISADAWNGPGLRSAEQWVAWKCGMSYSRASQVVMLARRQAELPASFEAFANGELAVEQIAVVAKHAPNRCDRQARDFATAATVGQLRHSLSRYWAEPAPTPEPAPQVVGDGANEDRAHGHDGDCPAEGEGCGYDGDCHAEGGAGRTSDGEADGFGEGTVDAGSDTDGEPRPWVAPEPLVQPAPEDKVSMFFDDDGRYHFHADLSPELGALLDKTLAEIRDALFRSGRADVTWADAIEELCLRSIATINSASRSDRYRVYVHVDEKGGWLNGGPKVDDSVLHHILCNTVVQPVFEREGRPINLGRTVRTVPDRIARLILDRDRVCRNPMCNATRGLEIHHIVHDANGGPADTWNLGALCPHCHREHHRGRFTIEGNADEPDGLSFRRANGALIEPAGRPNPPIRPLPRPPDDHRYQHPIGERFESKWLSFIPSPEEVAKLKAAAQADDDRPDDWLAERYRQNERYRIGGWT